MWRCCYSTSSPVTEKVLFHFLLTMKGKFSPLNPRKLGFYLDKDLVRLPLLTIEIACWGYISYQAAPNTTGSYLAMLHLALLIFILIATHKIYGEIVIKRGRTHIYFWRASGGILTIYLFLFIQGYGAGFLISLVSTTILMKF